MKIYNYDQTKALATQAERFFDAAWEIRGWDADICTEAEYQDAVAAMKQSLGEINAIYSQLKMEEPEKKVVTLDEVQAMLQEILDGFKGEK